MAYILGGVNSVTTAFETSLRNIYSGGLSPARQQIVNAARAQLGKPYVWGTAGPNTFDCSGLVQYVFRTELNILLPRTTYQQQYAGRAVARANIQPGDILFFCTNDNDPSDVSHVGIYVGNGQMIDATNEQTGVKYSDINNTYWSPRYHSARNIID